jgi:hypothetical protein
MEKQYRATDHGYVQESGGLLILDVGSRGTAQAVADALNEAYARGRVSLAEELSGRAQEVIGSGGRE